ncbi:MAG: thioredoxin-disulfide reductase [archaeon]|nr:thioredoxin-disulfide reductase [archaeon]MCP8315014.1 thioredoxin-disulfide reductase [archaeon]MCP8315628.1 thioredoxin-disulfide reductase [archaeon]MCP8321311.1 thioredoxin-disulfide reductase [archaeon]
MRELIIIGSGPAGLTAAIYAARANLKPLVITGLPLGGQLMLTTEVENYPGFSDGIQGPELMDRMRKQAEKFGAEFIEYDVTSVNFLSYPFEVRVEDDVYKAKAIIIATGASVKWLGLESEQRLIGRGVSSCATCDAPFFKDKDVVVVGGGDTAIDDALLLTKHAKKVTIIHRRDKLRASKILQDRAFKNEKINFKWNSVVEDIIGDNKVEGIITKDVKTGEKSKMDCQGVFIAIGHKPNIDLFKGQIEIDDKGYIIKRNNTETNIKGVFVAGDVCDYRYRQAITAAGMGCQAAMDAEKYLESME